MMLNYNEPLFLNVGTGEEIGIGDLALMIKEIVNYTGTVVFDKTKPDGTPRKLMDSGRLFNLGWKPRISLKEGLELTYSDFVKAYGNHR